jgi:hypothetical protein
MFTALMVIIGIQSQFALSDSAVTLRSRNMPTNCHFVYEVNSEIELSWMPGMTGAHLRYQLFHEYDHAWQEEVRVPESCPDDSECRVLLQIRSMSTAEHFLFRKIKFFFSSADGVPVSPVHSATFGREFGEPCFNNPEETPFRMRSVTSDKEI